MTKPAPREPLLKFPPKMQYSTQKANDKQKTNDLSIHDIEYIMKKPAKVTLRNRIE